MKILVTGAAGQLGAATVELLSSDHDVVSTTRRELDLSDHSAVMSLTRSVRPDVVINCAAYNNVNGAEDAAKDALAGNTFAVQSLAEACAAVDATLVHYGTDFVFDGKAARPYDEDAATNPQGVYAASKLMGEWFALEYPKAYVLRVESLFGGARAKSSIDRIIDAVSEGRKARVFVDRVVSPSYVVDVARATRTLLERSAAAGLYHCVNSGETTWLGLAEEIVRLLAVPARLVPVKVADVPLRPPRPQYCALSNQKLGRAGVDMPSWQDALARYLELRRHREGDG